MSQLAVFAPIIEPLAVPNIIRMALEQGATLAVSLSGGKDSQALLIALERFHRINNYSGSIYALHADLGRAEWPQTPAFVEELANRYDLPLVITRRPKGDLVARVEERLESTKGTGKPFWPDAKKRYCTGHLKATPLDSALRKMAPFWPSSAQRYCTSDLKRGPLDTVLRQSAEVVISAEGVRADESLARAKKPVVEIRTGITSLHLRELEPEAALSIRKPGQRLALNWRPLLHWNTEQIWQECGTSADELRERQAMYRAKQYNAALQGWPAHPAYVFGNSRLSCALCVLGSKSDLTNGANHNPELYAHYLKLERDGNATFKNGWSLSELPVTGRAKEVRDEFLNAKP